MKNNPFLPDGEKIPDSGSGYMRFEMGENKIRVVGSAITGYELWINNGPIRHKKRDFTPEELNGADINKFTGKKKQPQYFWAFPVYNYQTETVQILEITQRTIIDGINNYLNDEDYGNPFEYDLVITKDEDNSGKVVYLVKAKPPKEFTLDMTDAKPIDLQALYAGEDPFAQMEELNNDEIDAAISK